MFKILFCVALVWFNSLQITSGTESVWFDDLDGPKFLTEEEGQIYDDDQLEFDDDSTITKRVAADEYVTTVSSKNTEMFCKVAAHSQGITTTKWNPTKPTHTLSFYRFECRPFPTMVELERPANEDYLPHTVVLHRCLGGCVTTQQVQNCTVKRQEEVVLQVLHRLDHNKVFKPLKITVYNHTECACDCITRQSECDVKIHNFTQDQCKCKCKQDNSSSCDPAKMFWNEKICDCECNSAPKFCDKSPNHEWNAGICDCDCKQRVKERCIRKGKVLNTNTCECECPTQRSTCPPGESFLKYNCTCVPNSVVTK